MDGQRGAGRGRAQGRGRSFPPETPSIGRARGVGSQPNRPPQAAPQPIQQQSQPDKAVARMTTDMGRLEVSQAPGLTGRGASRDAYSFVHSRPETLMASKKGEFGNKIVLKANYFKLITRPKWILYQYRVDFSPEEDRTMVRKSMLREHKPKIGGYLFDGTVLYTPHRIDPMPLIVHSQRREDQETFTITIKVRTMFLRLSNKLIPLYL
jgi:aubergine